MSAPVYVYSRVSFHPAGFLPVPHVYFPCVYGGGGGGGSMSRWLTCLVTWRVGSAGGRLVGGGSFKQTPVYFLLCVSY